MNQTKGGEKNAGQQNTVCKDFHWPKNLGADNVGKEQGLPEKNDGKGRFFQIGFRFSWNLSGDAVINALGRAVIPFIDAQTGQADADGDDGDNQRDMNLAPEKEQKAESKNLVGKRVVERADLRVQF